MRRERIGLPTGAAHQKSWTRIMLEALSAALLTAGLSLVLGVFVFVVFPSLGFASDDGSETNPAASVQKRNRQPAVDSRLDPTYQALQDPAYEDCGQSCHKEHANDVIVVKTAYNKLLYRKMADALANNKDYSAVANTIGPFCESTGKKVVNVDTAQDCLNRYKIYAGDWFKKSRDAWVQNNESMKTLNAERGNQLYSEELAKQKKPFSPLIPEYESPEMKAKLKRLASLEYKRLLDMMPKPPSPEEFAKTQSIPRDPKYPEAGSLTVYEREADQLTLKFDRKAFEKAHKDYEARKKDFDQDLANFKAYRQATGGDPVLLPPQDDTQKHAYIEARNLVVDAFNRGAGQGGGAEPKPSRSTASKADALAKAKKDLYQRGFTPEVKFSGSSASSASGMNPYAEKKFADLPPGGASVVINPIEYMEDTIEVFSK